MKNMINLFLFLTISYLAKSQTIERQVVASGGNFAIAESLSLSFTIGELAILPLETNNLLLLQGFQQGESPIPTSIQNPSRLQFLVYPNPTKDWVRISLIEKVKTSLKISILNAEGRALQQQIFSEASPGIELNLEKLPSGSYFILMENAYGEKGSAPVIKQ